MTRRISLRNPFVGGMVTDHPAWEIAEKFTPFAQDGYSPSGVFKQRGGWAYDGTTADVADNLAGVYRADFVLADVTRTITGDDDGDLFIHNDSSAGTAIYTGTVEYLPRAIYRDELILCAQDGQTPLLRYSGADSVTTYSSGTPTWTADQSTVTGITFSGSPDTGSYIMATFKLGGGVNENGARAYPRVLSGSSTSFVVEDVVASATEPFPTFSASITGLGSPCVSVYEEGTMESVVGIITGFGTKWNSTYALTENDHILAFDGTDYEIGYVTSASSDTSMTSSLYNISKTAYKILRSMPFTDVASHKESLFGSGVVQYPSRVYVGPPRWNISFSPGRIPPVDPTEDQSFTNPNDALMDFIDVPSALDSDPIVAILSSPNPLLVLKRNAVYGVYGSYPSFSVDMIADGLGCIDIRSAWSYDEGQFWAGEGGIYWFTGGRIIDLTKGRINREWRALTRDFDYGTNDYCSLGLSQGHLVVHITTAGGNTRRTFLCDLSDQSWQSRISNFTPRFMFTSRVPGEEEKLLAVSNDRQGRVLDFAPALNGAGTALDDAGTGPRLQAWTPEGIDGSEINDDTRLLDLAVHANVYDATAAGSTNVAVSVVTQDALTEEGTVTTDVGDIASDTTDRIDRTYFRSVNKRGRRHQVRLEVDTLGTDTAATKVEVAEIDLTFRGSRNRT